MTIYYDKHKAITRLKNNIKVMIELGGRSQGKTHAWAIYFAHRKKGCCLWIRRKSDELRLCTHTFTDYLIRNGDTEIGKMGKKEILMHDGSDRKIVVDVYYNPEGEEKIVFVPLSLAHKFKSSQLGIFDYAVYDEFTSITGDYLKNEDIILMENLSTQMRLRDFNLILIGNNCDPFNPILNFFSIRVDYDKEFTPIYNGDGVKIGYVHLIKANENFIEEYEKSGIGILTAGSKYNDYALNNRTLFDTSVAIAPNSTKMKQVFQILYKEYRMFIHVDEDGIYHLTSKGDRTQIAYTNDIKQVNSKNKIVFSDEVMYLLRPAIKYGHIVAEDELVLSRLYDWMGIL